MDGRRIALLWLGSLFASAGCITSSTQKLAAPPSPPPAAPKAPVAQAVESPTKNDPRRTPRVLIAFAKFKEDEAKALEREPEQQFKVRDQARQLYQEAIKLDGNSIEAHRGLCRVYCDLNDFDRAQDTIKKAMAKFPKESVFWYEQAQMHNRKKDFAEATRCLNKAMEMDPENRLYVTTLGFTLARAGQIDQAVTLLSRSMGVASAHYNVARMLLHLQRTDEGVNHLRQAVQINPNLDPARQLLDELERGDRPVVTLDFQAGQ